MDEDGNHLHIVMFPWLAFGHLLPFLELAKSLAKRGHHITFISSPRNLHRLPAIPPHLSPLIQLLPLPLPPIDGLPLLAEATIDLPLHHVPLLKKAFDGLAGPFAAMLHNNSPKPDWIIIDFAHHWAPGISSNLGIPSAFFSVFHAATMAFMGPPSELESHTCSRTTPHQFTMPPTWIPFPSTLAFRHHEVRVLLGHNENNISEISDCDRFAAVLRGCNLVALRSCKELEADWLHVLTEIYMKPVLPVGLLSPAMQATSNEGHKLFEWLDGQAARSVVYVAFGSEASLSIAMLQELAYGLELSKLPFLWALRRPAGTPEGVEILPEGFEERTKGCGVVTMNWIPQLRVLAHGSIGGFLTHCGWSSIIESLQFGHPMIMLPVSPDQALIARVMAEKKIGLEVEKDKEGSFEREMVAKVVRLVVVEEEGEIFRITSKEMSGVFADKDCHEGYVDGFVQYLKAHRTPVDG